MRSAQADNPRTMAQMGGAPQRPRGSAHRALRTGVGCLAILWVFPGLLVATFGTWAISGDEPTPTSSQQATVFFVIYLIGLIGLPAWWFFLRRR